jgi:predicted enzyme related to lactoylglutathione lyase
MNRIVYFEFHTPDTTAAMRFYEQAFGWTFNRFPGPEEYYAITTGAGSDGINGGLMKSRDGQPRAVNVVQVEDLNASLARVTGVGGKVVVPRMEIPNVGSVAYCTDPGGLIFGVWQPLAG